MSVGRIERRRSPLLMVGQKLGVSLLTGGSLVSGSSVDTRSSDGMVVGVPVLMGGSVTGVPALIGGCQY